MVFTTDPADMLAVAVAVYCLCTAAVQAADSSTADAGVPGASFFESFGPGWQDIWHYSNGKKYEGRFDTVQPEGYQDTAIQMPAGNQHYGMTAQLQEPLLLQDGIVVQYEVQFSQGHSCGGAYLKLLSQTAEEFKPRKLRPKTPFSIMFGPDRCGPDSRVHVILNALNPVTQQVIEHHLMSAPAPKDDKLSHVYTLVLYPNQMYKVLIDGKLKGTGLLAAADFSPPLQPPAELPDPEHIKPEDWVEEEEIDDPAAVKPDDWDDRKLIPDPNAQKPHGWLDALPARVADPAAKKPEKWDDDRHGYWMRPSMPNPACEGAPGCGPWTAPMISNPSYKGPWIPPKVKNPAYKGPWQQRTLPNPAYFKAEAPLSLLAPIVGVAFELWVTEPGYTFDNILIGRGQQGLEAAAYMGKAGQARRLAQEAAIAAAARDASRPPGWRHWPANQLLDFFESPKMTPYQAQLQPVVAALQRQPLWGWLAPLLLQLIVLRMINRALVGKSGGRAGAAAPTKEELEEAAALEEDRKAEEQIKQDKQAAKLRAASKAAAAAEAAAAADGGGGVARRRSTRHQQLQLQQQHEEEEGEAAMHTPALQRQQQEDGAGSSPEDGQGTSRARSTRRTARKA